MPDPSTPALGILEIGGLTPSLVALDAAEKAGDVCVVQAELNDQLGVCIKIEGSVAAVEAAVRAGAAAAGMFAGAGCVSHVIPRPGPQTGGLVRSPADYSPILEADVVFNPRFEPARSAASAAPGRPGKGPRAREPHVSEQVNYAIGFIETQGFTAVIEAIDTACKAADVAVLGKEKLGGGYVTVVLKGDVAAIKAAIDAGRQRVDGLGELIAAHVIARPSAGVLALLPTE